MAPNSVKVLAIDDNRDNLITLKAVLHDALPAATALTAMDGPQGIELAVAENPDVILLDIVMPGMDGFDVCRKLKADERSRHIPVVFMTALKTDRQSRVRALEAGADGFLSKPVDEAVLTAQIQAMAKVKIANEFVRQEKEQLAALVEERTRELETELVERRKVEEALLHANQVLESNRIATLNLLEDLQQENQARKNSEQALRESEARYRSVFDNAAIGIELLDAQGRFLQVNGALARIFGYSEEELLNLTMRDITHPDDMEDSLSRHQEMVKGQSGSYRFEKRFIRKNGDVIWADVSASPVRGPDGGPVAIVGVIADITERKNAEQAMRASEEKYRTLFEESFDGLFITSPGGQILDMNKKGVAMFGYDTKEEVSRLDLERDVYAHPPDRKRILSMVNTQGSAEYEVVVKKKSGEEMVTFCCLTAVRDETGKITSYRGIIRDITDRKRAEEALRESEDKFKHVFQSANVGKSVTLLTGEIHVNKAFCDMLGYSEDELRNRTWQELTPPEEVRAIQELVDPLVRGEKESVRFNKRYIHKNGSYIWGDVSVAVRRDHAGKPLHFITTVVDITERKEAEKRMRLNEARLQSLHDIAQYKAESTQDLLDFALNEAIKLTGSRVGYIYHYDEERRLFELNTWSKEVMKQCEIAEPQTLYELEKTGIWGEAVRQRRPILVNNYQAPNPLKRGYPEGHVELTTFMTIPVFVGERIVAVIGMGNKDSDYDDSDVRQLSLLMDAVWRITEARRVEAEQRRLATAVEHAEEGVMITDIDGTIEYVNDACVRMTGYEKEELIGKNPRMLKSGEQDEAFYSEIWRTIGSGKGWAGRIINRKKDGTLYTAELTISPVRDPSGTVVNFVALQRDITQHLELSRQLFQAQKMEAVGTLAGGVAHDFNNVLQVALGFSELLLGDEEFPTHYRGDMQKIYDSAKRGADLVQRLLTFSRKTEIKPQPLNLNARITDLQKMLDRTLPKMIAIQLSLKRELSRINADKTQIEQVIMNLAVNARDAMPDGGKLIFETSDVVLDEQYARMHVDAKPGPHVLLTVTDTGSGMDKDILEHIFEPFYTTKGVGEGTGLGLAMVHGIVQQHGGHVRCYSEPGQGTTFKVYFPALVSHEEAEETVVRRMPRGGSETILLVDDEEMIRDFGSRILTKAGYTVVLASNGKEALAAYGRHGDEIALVILDLIMPEMGGKQCLENLLRENPAVKVVIASGFSADGPTRDALAGGASGFVTKPYDMRQVLEVVREVLDAGNSSPR